MFGIKGRRFLSSPPPPPSWSPPPYFSPVFLAHPRRAPPLSRFSFACSISAPPEKGKESAATQAKEKITRHRAATNESDEWFLSFLSLYSEIIKLYLFSGARSLLFAKLTEDQMIRKSCRLWNFVESFFKLLFCLISSITVIFFNRFSLESSLVYSLLFSFIIIVL